MPRSNTHVGEDRRTRIADLGRWALGPAHQTHTGLHMQPLVGLPAPDGLAGTAQRTSRCLISTPPHGAGQPGPITDARAGHRSRGTCRREGQVRSHLQRGASAQPAYSGFVPSGTAMPPTAPAPPSRNCNLGPVPQHNSTSDLDLPKGCLRGWLRRSRAWARALLEDRPRSCLLGGLLYSDDTPSCAGCRRSTWDRGESHDMLWVWCIGTGEPEGRTPRITTGRPTPPRTGSSDVSPG